MKKARRPPKERIVEYWGQHPLGELLNWSGYTGETFCCMACGGQGRDRAHIKGECSGGSVELSNIHLLCSSCHKESEEKTGFRYWLWIRIKSTLFHKGSDMCYEIDNGMEFPMPYEYKEKLNTYGMEYFYHSKLTPFHDRENYMTWAPQMSVEWALCLMRPDMYGLSFDPVNIGDIIENIQLEELNELEKSIIETVSIISQGLEASQ